METVDLMRKFGDRFGADQAAAVLAAAQRHLDDGDMTFTGKGSDQFRWALVRCIGFGCLSRDSFREHHGITAPWAEIKDWIKEHARLDLYDGENDWIALMAGMYDEFMPKKENPDA